MRRAFQDRCAYVCFFHAFIVSIFMFCVKDVNQQTLKLQCIIGPVVMIMASGSHHVVV